MNALLRRLCVAAITLAAAGALIVRAAGQTPAAQTAPASAQAAALRGRVVDAVTGAPVSDAIVALIPIGAAADLGPAQRMTTKADGAFAFDAVPPGSYQLNTTAPHTPYAPSGYGKTRADGATSPLEIAPGRNAADVLIREWKNATLTGTLADNGKPVVLATVIALRRETRDGLRRDSFAAETMTFPNGSFTFVGLAPGDYIVGVRSTSVTIPQELYAAFYSDTPAAPAARGALEARLSESGAPLPSRAFDAVGPWRFGSIAGAKLAPLPLAPGAAGAIFLYSAIFYPSAASPAQAKIITLGAGETQNGLRLETPVVAATRVSGVVTAPDGLAAHLGLRLVPADLDREIVDTPIELATTVTDANGAFSFLGVPPGNYALQAWTMHDDAAPSQFAERPAPNGRPTGRVGRGISASVNMALAVTPKGVTALAVTLAPPPKVTGHLVFDGPAPQAPDAITLALDAAGTEGWPLPSPIHPSANGEFTFDGYAPGAYALRTPASGSWRVKSVMLDGHDVTDRPFDVEAGSHALVVTLTTTSAGR